MATMVKPKALAIASRSTVVAPETIPPATAAPQPTSTRAKVPTNSAACLFIARPSNTPQILANMLIDWTPVWEEGAGELIRQQSMGAGLQPNAGSGLVRNVQHSSGAEQQARRAGADERGDDEQPELRDCARI